MADDTTQADDDFAAGFEAADAEFAGTADDAPQDDAQPAEVPATETPAPTDDPTGTPVEEPATEEKPPWEAIPEEYRGEFIKLAQRAQNFEHSFRSEQGRSQGQQNRVKELEARLAELEQGPAAQAEEAKPSDANMEALDASLPEVAEELRALRKANEQLRADLDRRVKPVEQTSQQVAISRQEAALEAAHPDWLTVAQSSEFNAAMASAPKLIRDAFEQNSQNIVDAENAAFVIGWYKSQNGAAVETSPPKQTQAGQVKQRRAQTIQQAVAPAVRDSVTPQADETAADDFEAGWAAADRDIRQHRI